MAKKAFFKHVDPKQDFVALERRILDNWQKKGIVKKYLERNTKSPKKFSFLDGPITANNPMGVHHAWGRTYKDLWQRFYNMRGFAQRFQNGFDEQGLWVEVEVEKELGFKNKKDIEKYGIDRFVERCKERVKKYSKVQTEQSKRLGYFMDWDNSYHTSSDDNNYAIWNFLKVCHQKGYLYKGRDSVPWCPRCGTAISQHEILTEEYQEITHKAVYVKYKINRQSLMVNRQLSTVKGQLYLLVWTTTPWTLPSNVAIAVNPELDYGSWAINDESVIIGAKRAKQIGITQKPKVKFKGKELVGFRYQGIFDDLPALKGAEHMVVAAKDLVSEEEGTSLVHIAPGAGAEDFALAKQENLAVVESIDESANYIEGFGDLSGKNAKENPQLIVEKLRAKGVLFREENYKHRYPICWRCKTELVWRVVDEWYIAMDHPSPEATDGELSKIKSKTLRQQMIDVAKKIHWIPKFGLERELDWLANMHDWLISKKRYWGLALPIWECESCGNFEVIGSKLELEKRAIEGWEQFQGHSPHRPWIDQVKIRCSQCQSVVARIPDVGNPWLDAGIVPFSTMPQEWFPADFITESFPGQFKNWFYSLIAMSTVLKNTNPFKTVLGFVTLLDEEGQEMHKSKGNAIEFNEAANIIGVDVMRWLYTTQSPVNNLLFGYHKADEARRRFYLILWNTYVFFVAYANLNNWYPTNELNAKDRLPNVLDKWILSRFNLVLYQVTKSLTNYNARQASLKIEDFVVNDLSTWYVRRSRDRFSLSFNDLKDKESGLAVLYDVLIKLVKILAPFTPFVADEMYQNLTRGTSVHLADWPDAEIKLINKELEQEMQIARQIVEKAHFIRKEAVIKVRQPLAQLLYGDQRLSPEIEAIVADELNVKKVLYQKNSQVLLDLKITPNLKEEGQAREIIRQVQQGRKEAGCRLDEKISLILPSWPAKLERDIKRQTLAKSLTKGSRLRIKRN